jgi:anti-sigma factor RsiW
MTDDDAELVAMIDNELDDSSRAALLARLAADDRLRQRYEALRQIGAPLGASFDALLEQAPVARLRALLPPDEPLRQPSRRFAGVARRELVGGFVIGLLAAGAAAWAVLSAGLLNEREDWRVVAGT